MMRWFSPTWDEATCLEYVERVRRIAAAYGRDFYMTLTVDLATMPGCPHRSIEWRLNEYPRCLDCGTWLGRSPRATLEPLS